MGVTGIDRLNLSAALRYDNYPGVGKVVTPKLGLIYAPSPDIDIKGSWGRSFKAPTLFQQYNSLGVTAWPAANAGGTGYPGTAAVLLLTGGNPNLKPERAETWSATTALHPRALEGAQLEVSFFRVFDRDRIVAPITYLAQSLSNPIYANLVELNPSDATKAAVLANAGAFSNALGRTYNPADVVAIVNDNSTNASSQKIYGVDVSVRYKWSLDKDRSLTFNLRGSYLHSTQKLSDLQPTTSLAGTLFNPPHVRANGGLIWAQPDLTLSTSLNYTGGINDIRSARTARIGAMMTWDLAATYTPHVGHGPLRGMAFALSVTNALNAQPTPISGLTYETPYDSTNYTPFGRVVGLTVSRQCCAHGAPLPDAPTSPACGDMLSVSEPSAERSRDIRPDDLLRLRDIGPRWRPSQEVFSAISPDGRRMAFFLTRGDPQSNLECRALVSIALDGKGKPLILDSGGEPIYDLLNIRGIASDYGYP
ncbi:hypothetical protein E4T56_gene4885, partial [Termitomyces sp. T112]